MIYIKSRLTNTNAYKTSLYSTAKYNENTNVTKVYNPGIQYVPELDYTNTGVPNLYTKEK